MRVLYIAPEHVSGTLSLFKREHERRGDECRYVTFWQSRWQFPDDICLGLAGMPIQKWVRGVRDLMTHDPHRVPSRIENSKLPVWNPPWYVRAMFSLRDEYNWQRINEVIRKYSLAEYDIVHLDGGLDFTRDARFARSMKARGKPIVSYFHGSDLRSRGFIPQVEEITDLRLTPEWDLHDLDSRIHYLYLPFDAARFPTKPFRPGKVIRIAHAARNPLKGTDAIVRAIESLSSRFPLELVLIRNMSYESALAAKFSCDIFIDQLTNEGGWGYGMSSVEALAMGIPVITNIPDRMLTYIGDHPFIVADTATLAQVLDDCLSDWEILQAAATRGVEWVLSRHEIQKVGDALYGHYRRLDWCQ